ncbi:MAG: putative toxin-antitoxin system toxin component, PIN family [Bacteroidetes bacterium CG_4_10_14_3_um_filter_31_20]|nr:MAG: putative toxin-antitoxin system toxin component, PIN family [Bacteroidetes bacterium CG_4_10_14_3_um_filter_31_20]
MLKILIDSNIWISFLIGKSLKGLQNFLHDKRFIIITSDEQMSELIEVLNRPKFKKYFTKEQIIDFLKLIEQKSQIFKNYTRINICRDEKDNYLLSIAIDSKADYLITGDKDLIELKEINDTQIINFKDFESKFMNY